MTVEYNDRLDADRQITMEEKIAYLIFERCETSEETAQELGCDILLTVLEEFRKDLIA